MSNDLISSNLVNTGFISNNSIRQLKEIKKYLNKDLKYFSDFDITNYFNNSDRKIRIVIENDNENNLINIVDIIQYKNNIIVFNIDSKKININSYYDNYSDFIDNSIHIYKKNNYDIYQYNKILKKLNINRFSKKEKNDLRAKLYVHLIESYSDKLNIIESNNITNIHKLVELFGSKLNFLSYCEDLFDDKIRTESSKK